MATTVAFAIVTLLVGGAGGETTAAPRPPPTTGPFFGLWSSTTLAPTADWRLRLRAEIADELLLMAVGRHAYFVDGLLRRSATYGDEWPEGTDGAAEATDQRQHTQAAVALHLLQRLRFMEAVDEKLRAAADEITASSTLEYRTAMQVFYEQLQHKVEQDGAVLAAFMDAEADARRWLDGLPATRRRFSAARTLAPATLLRMLSRESAFLRRLAVCTLFLEAAVAPDVAASNDTADAADDAAAKDEQHRHSRRVAKNVLKLARYPETVQDVDRVFKMAVDETAAEETDVRDAQRTLDILCRKLLHKIRGDAILNSESTRARLLRLY